MDPQRDVGHAAQGFSAMRAEEDERRRRRGCCGGRGDREQAGDACKVRFGGGAEPAVVAHALKTFGRDVLQEPAHELLAGHRAALFDVIAVAAAEGHRVASPRLDARGMQRVAIANEEDVRACGCRFVTAPR